MKRRAFIAGLGSAVAWPLVARAQQPNPLVFYLVFGAAGDMIDRFPAFLRGLNEAGFVDGRNVTVERPTLTSPDELPVLVADLVKRRPSVIYAGTYGTALLVKKLTSTIPIVTTGASDPITVGLVASMSRPGGNVTGTRLRAGNENTKLLELLHELVPGATTVGMLINPAVDLGAEPEAASIEVAGRGIGLKVIIARVNDEAEFVPVFTSLAQANVGGLVLGETRYLAARRNQVAGLALRYSIPTISSSREFAVAGGLAGYGPSIDDAFQQAGFYVGRILRGDKPAELPILQPTKFSFVINLKTAKTLGLMVPETLLLRADEVIE